MEKTKILFWEKLSYFVFTKTKVFFLDKTQPKNFSCASRPQTWSPRSELIQLGRPDLVEKLHTILPKDAAAFTRRAWEPPPKRGRANTGPTQPDDLIVALDEAVKEHNVDNPST